MSDPMTGILLSATAGLTVVVALGHLCGRVAVRIGQPAVVGEMISGVLLGPTVLGALAPGLSGALFSAPSRPTLYVISIVGLTLFMFLVGLEHDVRPRSRRDAAVPQVLAAAGFAVPLGLGALVAAAVALPLRPPGVPTLAFLLFMGGALSVTAFPMLARVLQERDMVHTRFGGVATRAAAIDDALAWCVLALVTGLLLGDVGGAVVGTLLPAAAFVVAAFLVLPRLFRPLMEASVRGGSLGDRVLVAVLVAVLAAGWFTDLIGIYSVFGGFVCGVAMPRVPGFAEMLSARLLPMVRCLFLPVFFAYSGLNTDLLGAWDAAGPWVFVSLLLAAAASKFLASLLVLRGFGWSWGTATAMGGLMNARGLMILIFINAGSSLGILDRGLFSILVLVAITTTALALPVYRLHFDDEREDEARRGATPRPAPSGGPRRPDPGETP